MKLSLPLPGLALLLTACSPEPNDDVPPLPKQTAETANQLMAEAERAAADAGRRSEPKAAPEGSSATTNEVIR